MFSTDSFKYLKSLASKYRDTLPRPAALEDEFIMYADTLVKGLNFNSHQKYSLEYALSGTEDQKGMEALILKEGWPGQELHILLRATGAGKFFLEVHTTFEESGYPAMANEPSFRQLANSLFDQPGFSRYFTLHSEGSLSENRHFIRYEMPLRQVRSRNLVEYSIFILEQATPFIESALKVREEIREAVAA